MCLSVRKIESHNIFLVFRLMRLVYNPVSSLNLCGFNLGGSLIVYICTHLL